MTLGHGFESLDFLAFRQGYEMNISAVERIHGIHNQQSMEVGKLKGACHVHVLIRGILFMYSVK